MEEKLDLLKAGFMALSSSLGLNQTHVSIPKRNLFNLLFLQHGTEFLELLPVHQNKLVGLIIMTSLCCTAGLMLLITVCRDKCIRNQVQGFLLINMAVSVLLFALTGLLPRIEAEATHMTSVGKVGCNLVYYTYHASIIEFVIVLVLLGRDSFLFLFKKRYHSTTETFLLYSSITWLVALTFVVFGFEVTVNGFEFVPYNNSDDKGACVLQPSNHSMMFFYSYVFLVMYVLPAITVIIVTSFFIWLSQCYPTDTIYTENRLAFILSGVSFVVLGLPYYIIFFYYENSDVSKFTYSRSAITFVFGLVKDFSKPLICLIWLFTIPQLRNTFLWRRLNTETNVEEEKMHLLETK